MSGTTDNRKASSSQLPRVLLRVNPGLSRQLDQKMAVLDKLRAKEIRAAEQRNLRFRNDVELRLNNKQKNVVRRSKIGEATRRVRLLR